MNGNDTANAIGWALGFIKARARRLWLVLFLSFPAVGLGLVQPYLTKILIDDGILARRMDVIVWTCGLFLLASLSLFAINAVHRWLYIDVSSRILFDMREETFRHLLKLSPRFYTHHKKGDILSRIDGDIAQIQRFGTDTLLMLINNTLLLIGSLLIMLSLSWRLTALAFVLLPAQVFFYAPCARALNVLLSKSGNTLPTSPIFSSHRFQPSNTFRRWRPSARRTGAWPASIRLTEKTSCISN